MQDGKQGFTGAIVYCPVCVTPIDATKWGEESYDCLTCDTSFTVKLEAEKVAQFALYG